MCVGGGEGGSGGSSIQNPILVLVCISISMNI